MLGWGSQLRRVGRAVMKVSLWVDVWAWSEPNSLEFTKVPRMPKPWRATRYRVDVEIPESRGEDEVIEAKGEREE